MALAKKLKLDFSLLATTPTDSLVLPPFVRRGDPLDEYDDIMQVGCGAFGFIYRGKPRSGGNPKAIKVVNAGPRETDKIRIALNVSGVAASIEKFVMECGTLLKYS